MEAVAHVVSTVPGDNQASATRALLDPVLSALQQCLQQPQQNGAGLQQKPQQQIELVAACVDRLGVVFR